MADELTWIGRGGEAVEDRDFSFALGCFGEGEPLGNGVFVQSRINKRIVRNVTAAGGVEHIIMV
jgi:hypothetical protein